MKSKTSKKSKKGFKEMDESKDRDVSSRGSKAGQSSGR